MKLLSLPGFHGRNRRHALLGVAVFFVVFGISFTLPKQISMAPPVAFAQSTPDMCVPSDIGWCDTPDAYFVFSDLDIPAGSVLHLEKSVVVVNGAHLAIGAGTEFIFSKGDGSYTQPLGLVAAEGRISAIGTTDDPIVFTKEDEETEFTIYLSGATATFEHVRIERGGEGTAEPVFQAWLQGLLGVARADSYWDVIPAIWYEKGEVIIRDSVISGSGGADIFLPGEAQWRFGGPDGGSSFLVERTDFGCDTEVPAMLNGNGPVGDPVYPSIVTLSDNWYGSADGPRTSEHVNDRSGKEIIGPVNLGGFVSEPYVERCASNVLFLPGIKASRLYMSEEDGGEDKLWPPNDFIGNDVEDLHFDGDGKSEHDVYTRDVISEILPPIGSNIYKSFLGDLETMKGDYVINDHTPFAYDWRQSVMDIVENGTPYEDGIRSPVDELIRLAESSKSGQVTIVAHSNGGLLAKALMVRLEEMGREDLVDRIVLVASPQMGTPVSILTLLYGYEESIVKGYILRLLEQWEARELIETIPGAFGLLPSAEYFERSLEDIVSFASGDTSSRLSAYRDAYGSAIDNWGEFVSFLSGEGDGREEPDQRDTDLENVLDTNLLYEAEILHDRLDTWTPPENVEVIEIAGWGLDTVLGIRYVEREKGLCLPTSGKIPMCLGNGEYEMIYEPVFTVDGDEIVTAPSAHMIPEAENVKRYWVDLHKKSIGLKKNYKHKNIIETSEIREVVSNILQNKEIIISDILLGERPENFTNASSHIRMSLYSPLDVHITDASGNHIGPREVETEGGLVTVLDENIPGSTYFQFGERKYVSFPSGEPVDIRLEGYADGAYTLKFEEIEITQDSEEIVSHTTFEYLPTTADTTVTLSVPEEGLSGLSPLTADIDGDGALDYEIEPVPDGIATLEVSEDDSVPPVTTAIFSGPEGDHDWFLDDVTVTLSADDGADGSGIIRTEYSLDNGESWEGYAGPFTVSYEGTTFILFHSTDEAGNVEESKQTEVKIDRTPPVARVGFDTDTRKIIVSGSDEQSEVMIERREEDISPKRRDWGSFFSWIPNRVRDDRNKVRVHVILIDEAGHETDVAFTEERKYGTSFSLSDFSIIQDEGTLDASSMYASYNVVPGRWGMEYAYISSFLRTRSESALSWYSGRRNMTWVTSVFKGGEMERKQESGAVVPSFEVDDTGIRIILE